MEEKWSQTAWRAVEPVYEAIVRHPFVKELAAGTLEAAKFKFYLQQDALYLASYCKSLARLASRLSDPAAIDSVLHFAANGIAVEAALHRSYLQGCGALPPMSPTCLMYTAVEEAQALRPVAVDAAALLPCFWVYQRVGQSILAGSRDLQANPYARWIETYADATFEEATRRYIDICDSLAEAATDSERREMTEIFLTCTRLEWMFWDSAYRMEQWKV